LREALIGVLNIDLPIADWAKEEGIGEEEVSSRIHAAGDAAYAQRIEKNGADVMRYVEKQIVLQVLDHFWREHLVMLDHLRQVIGWRGYAQRDPLNEYKSEAFELFPGDIIYSGTPENVGPVVKGDVILCKLDQLPDLSIKIV
jgi:preprotein translocase subunit SecA